MSIVFKIRFQPETTMGLLLTSKPAAERSEKDTRVSSLRKKFEGENADLFGKDEWIDFASIDIAGVGDETKSHAVDNRRNADNRDEQFNNMGGFENADEENREEHATPNSKNSVVKKWDNFIRASHGNENAGNRIELDETDENSSRLRKSQSVGVLTNKSVAFKSKSERRSFGLGDITNQSVALKPARGRRSFGLDEFNADIDKLFPTSVTEQMSSDISKLTLKDSSSKGKQEPKDIIELSEQVSIPNGATSIVGESPGKESVASQDSDGSEFKKLVILWNGRSPMEGKRSFSTRSPSRKEDAIKAQSNNPGDSRNPENIASKGDFDSEIREGNKLTLGNTQPIRALVILEQPHKFDLITGEAIQKNDIEEQLVIRKLNRTTESMECQCSSSAFSGNEDLISFFLPLMGAACKCGRNQKSKLINPNEPTALENILRPWQVEFLKSFDIHRGEEFIKARRQSPTILARGLRQWRKKNDMMTFKTTSCTTALQIWSKVCKSYVRSIRRQTLAGEENLELEPADASLAREMSQFLGDLPTAPKRRNRSSKETLDIEPESQFEI